MDEKPRVWIESEPFRWLGRAVFLVLIVALLALWWHSITPARAATPVPTFQFAVTCDGAYCMMPKAGLDALMAANQDLAAKLNAARAAGCESRRGTRL